jgi:dicarboxylate transporter 10
LQLLFCSTSAGALGGAFGNPSDVVNVRMQNDGQLPPAMRRNYRNAIDGLIRICREESPKVLARGIGPNMNRAILMTCSQLTSYDVCKEFLLGQLRLDDGFMVHLESSIFAVSSNKVSPQ